jgi:hypothetical protein
MNSAREEYDRAISAFFGVRTPSGETIANAIEALRKLIAPETTPGSDTEEMGRINRSVDRIGRSVLDTIKFPAAHPIGTPGSVMREAWDIGKMIEDMRHNFTEAAASANSLQETLGKERAENEKLRAALDRITSAIAESTK